MHEGGYTHWRKEIWLGHHHLWPSGCFIITKWIYSHNLQPGQEWECYKLPETPSPPAPYYDHRYLPKDSHGHMDRCLFFYLYVDQTTQHAYLLWLVFFTCHFSFILICVAVIDLSSLLYCIPCCAYVMIYSFFN